MKKMQFKIRPREGANIWKDITPSWTRRLHIAKMSLLSKVIYRVSASPVKIPVTFFFFAEGEKSILKFIKLQGTSNVPSNLERKNKIKT